MENDLIFDIGMHTGVDTEFYLAKGFRVVAVEANPNLVQAAKAKFATAIADGRLRIEHYGIHEEEGTLAFFVNDHCNEWSSFRQHLGTREGTRFHKIEVQCKRLSYFIEKYGMPYFLKIDVEGMDVAVVRQLTELNGRPTYASIEDGGIQALIAMYESGARRFKFSNQLEVRDYILPNPALEGKYVDHSFGLASSGPFGEELPGEWMAPEWAFHYYLERVRPPGQPPINGWWDIHGWY